MAVEKDSSMCVGFRAGPRVFFSDFLSVLWVSWVCLLFLFFICFLYTLYSNFFLSLFLDAVEMSLISSFLWSSSHGVSWISLHHGKRFYFCFFL